MSGRREAPYSRKQVGALILLVGVSCVGLLAFVLFGDEWNTPHSSEADAYSLSALGHAALFDLLETLDYPVEIGRYRSGPQAGRDGVVVVAEPSYGAYQDDAFYMRDLVESAPAVLIVLRRRFGYQDPGNPAWIQSDGEIALGEDSLTDVLRAIDLSVELVRPGAEDFYDWEAEELPYVPTLSEPQLMRSRRLRPLVECRQGMLAGRFVWQGTPVVVVSDPDLLANHGLHRGQNASIVLGLIDHLRRPGGKVVIDETLHGFYKEPSLTKALVEPPIVYVSLHVLVLLVLGLWAASRRFGELQRPPADLEPGSRFLIRTTGGLLRSGKRGAWVLNQYFEDTVRVVSERLHVPQGLEPEQHAARLDDVCRRIKTTHSFTHLQRRVAQITSSARTLDQRSLETAAEIHRWREEILDGPGRHR